LPSGIEPDEFLLGVVQTTLQAEGKGTLSVAAKSPGQAIVSVMAVSSRWLWMCMVVLLRFI